MWTGTRIIEIIIKHKQFYNICIKICKNIWIGIYGDIFKNMHLYLLKPN